MQIWAYDQNRTLIPAYKAEKGRDYHCIECQKKIRVRSGLQRRIHFYHLELSPSCRLNGKSEQHLEIQYSFTHWLPHQDCTLEMRFPDIGRIADVVWHSQKIIFEIQCSPIAAAEALCRIQDYSSIGYQVIWILHENTFNRLQLSAAENLLLSYPHYFTNINAEGKGTIHDQFSLIEKGKRIKRSSPCPFEPNQACFSAERPSFKSSLLKSYFQKRFSHSKIYFKGDLFDLLEIHKEDLEQICLTVEKKIDKNNRFLRLYRALFHLFLENMTQ